jgi:cytochrome b subunit of formate dehydrogenase
MKGKTFLTSNGKYYKPHQFFYWSFLALEAVVTGSCIMLWPAFAIFFGEYLLIFSDNIIFLFVCSAIILFLLAYILMFFLAFLIPLMEVASYKEEHEEPKKSFIQRYIEYRAKHLNEK